MNSAAKVWEETVTIPIYSIGLPEKNPMFLEKRVYQESSGAVYPHPVVESISDDKVDKYYQAVLMENEYLKIMILQELDRSLAADETFIKQRLDLRHNPTVQAVITI
jgi:hypothetical protein